MKTISGKKLKERLMSTYPKKPSGPQTCSICGNPYEGYGNNARPVKDGRCCDDCNAMVVTPARMEAIKKATKKEDGE